MNISKFGALNVINICFYQDCLNILQDFILVKERIINLCISNIFNFLN